MSSQQPARHVQLREAKAKLSELVAAAEHGEETVITKHGRAVARIVPEPVEAGPKRVNDPASPYHGMTFLDLLMAFPGGIEFERDRTPMRDVEL